MVRQVTSQPRCRRWVAVVPASDVTAESVRPTPLVARTDAGYYMVSLAAVQGSSFFIQLLVAAALAPAEFAMVRTVEAYLSPLLVLAAAGLPSLAMARIPVQANGARDRLAWRLTRLSMGTGLVVAGLTAAVALLLLPAPLGRYLSMAAGVLAMGALSRTVTNVLLASGHVRPTAVATAAVSLIAIPMAAYGARHFGIHGWLVARYLAEGGLILAVMAGMRRIPLAPALESESTPDLLRVGALLSGSLLVRSVVDNLGPIATSRLGFSGVEIGAFALATVGVSAVLLAPGAIGNLAIRRFAVTRDSPTELRRAIMQGVWSMLGLSLVPCLAFVLLGELLLRWFFPQYQGTASLMSVVLWAAPWRAVTAVMGGVLVALDRSAATLWLNLISLAVAMVLQWGLSTRWGVWGSAWAVLLTDVFMFMTAVLMVRVYMPRSGTHGAVRR